MIFSRRIYMPGQGHSLRSLTGDRQILLAFLRWHRESEHRDLTASGDVQTLGVIRMWQVERFTEFTAIDLSVASVGLFDVSALLLEDVGLIEPALQVAAAQLALVVLFVTGTLKVLFDLDLMVRKLRNLRNRVFGNSLHAGCGHQYTSQESRTVRARVQSSCTF